METVGGVKMRTAVHGEMMKGSWGIYANQTQFNLRIIVMNYADAAAIRSGKSRAARPTCLDVVISGRDP